MPGILFYYVELRPGETPHDALTRVILHERVGHDVGKSGGSARVAQGWG
ncbi:MAG: hypothetical protein J0L73_14145 [Verrucomicrobia bacterium]|nr:hypothetical protein [Verrucomicrobiota bacterium]